MRRKNTIKRENRFYLMEFYAKNIFKLEDQFISITENYEIIQRDYFYF